MVFTEDRFLIELGRYPGDQTLLVLRVESRNGSLLMSGEYQGSLPGFVRKRIVLSLRLLQRLFKDETPHGSLVGHRVTVYKSRNLGKKIQVYRGTVIHQGPGGRKRRWVKLRLRLNNSGKIVDIYTPLDHVLVEESKEC